MTDDLWGSPKMFRDAAPDEEFGVVLNANSPPRCDMARRLLAETFRDGRSLYDLRQCESLPPLTTDECRLLGGEFPYWWGDLRIVFPYLEES